MSAPTLPAQQFSVPALTLRLALGLSLLSITGAALPALAAPGDVDSVNNGQSITAGVYYNTPGSKTTFTNTNGTGLYLRAGDLVRGLESNAAAAPTGNGGTLHFNAPGQLVRLDGNVDISGIVKNGVYTGNGGNAFVDAAMYLQNGNIYANGINGGNIQFNVGSALFGPGAQVQAMGSTGLGGNVAINSTGGVDMRTGVVVDTSGKNLFTYDRNVINIEGSFVNNQGILRANSVAQNDGHLALISGNTQAAAIDTGAIVDGNAAAAANSYAFTPFNRGGTIRLVATGQTNADCFNCDVSKGSATETNPFTLAVGQALLTADEATALQVRYNTFLTPRAEGNVRNRGSILANGNQADNAGTVLLSAANSIDNTIGLIQANGNSGGTIGLSARNYIFNNGTSNGDGGIITGRIQANSLGGNSGGLIAASYGTLFNNVNGRIEALGAPGGLMVFSGPTNPEGGTGTTGVGTGTIVSPGVLNTNFVSGSKAITQPDELLVRDENLILLARGNGPGTLPNHFDNAFVRSVSTPLVGTASVLTRGIFDAFTNLFVASTGTNAIRVTRPQVSNGLYIDTTNLNTFTMNHNGSLFRIDQGFWFLGAHRDNNARYFYSPLGGHYSWLANGDITNTNSQVITQGYLSGGSINLAANGNILNQLNSDWQTRVMRNPSSYTTVGNGGLYGGSIIAKATGNITNQDTSTFTTNPIGDIGSLRPGVGPTATAKFGGNLQFLAGNNFLNTTNSGISAWARYINSPGENINATGGNIGVRAGNLLVNNGLILANGETLLPLGGYNPTAIGQGGSLITHAGSVNLLGLTGFNSAFGSTNGGQVLMTAGQTPNTPADASATGSSLQVGNATYVNGVAPLTESVLIAGNIDTRGLGPVIAGQSRLGATRLGGEQQVGFANTATLNGVAASSFVDGLGNLNAPALVATAGNTQVVVGTGAVNAIACGGPLPTPADGGSSLVSGPTAPVTTVAPLDAFNLLGLFQNLRQLPVDRFAPNSSSRILLAFAQPNMFLARTYKPVTERILAAALEEYYAAQGTDTSLTVNSNGNNTARTLNNAATEQAQRYLQQAGVDGDVARQLLSQVDSGSLRADPIIVGILNKMAAVTPADSTQITQ